MCTIYYSFLNVLLAVCVGLWIFLGYVSTYKNRIENIRIFLKFQQKWSRRIQKIYSYFEFSCSEFPYSLDKRNQEFQEIFCCSLPYFSYIPWIFPDWKGQSWWLRCEWKEYNDIVGIMGVCPKKKFTKNSIPIFRKDIKKTFQLGQELSQI